MLSLVYSINENGKKKCRPYLVFYKIPNKFLMKLQRKFHLMEPSNQTMLEYGSI